MKEFHIHEIANEIDTSDYKIEVQLEVQANTDALRNTKPFISNFIV